LTVLADNFGEHSKCRVTPFRDYAHFKALLQSHDLLVGMDSFPAHYAAHVCGLPTLCLFANTRPENSNAPGLADYVFLEQGLKCRPCDGVARCPLDGQDRCANFVSPERVAHEVDRMSALADNARSRQRRDSPAVLVGAGRYCRPGQDDVPANRKKISLHFLGTRATLMDLLWPPLTRASRLGKEFSEEVRTMGILHACFRTARYLRKVVRGSPPFRGLK